MPTITTIPALAPQAEAPAAEPPPEASAPDAATPDVAAPAPDAPEADGDAPEPEMEAEAEALAPLEAAEAPAAPRPPSASSKAKDPFAPKLSMKERLQRASALRKPVDARMLVASLDARFLEEREALSRQMSEGEQTELDSFEAVRHARDPNPRA